ncbi:MAG: glycosyltransferase family 39 protein [Actinomycetota bacterium]
MPEEVTTDQAPKTEALKAWAGRAWIGLRKGTRKADSAWLRLDSRARMAVVVFLLCLLVFTIVMLLVPRYNGVPTTQGDEPHYLVITRSILSDGDVFLYNNYQAEQFRPFYEDDISMWHVVQGRYGRYVSTHPMFTSLLVLPGFWLAGYKGAAFTMILITCLAAAFTFALADRFVSRTVAVAATLLLFFTYPLLFYSRLIYPETPAILAVAAGTWAAWRLKESGCKRHAVLLGACAGGAMLLHPKFIAITIAFSVLFFMVTPGRNAKMLAAFLVPVALPVLLLLALTFITYGPNLLKGLTASGGSKFSGGYWGTNSVWGVPGLFLDRAWGLFIFAPVYMLFIAGLALQPTRLEWDRWWGFFALIIGLHALVLGVFQSWNGGAAPVQRYMVPLAPLFVVCIALLLDRVRHWLCYTVVFGLALMQLVTTIWAFRFMVGVYGMENTDNIFLVHFLRENPVKRFILLVFPLFHMANAWSVFLTVLWVGFFILTAWAARRYYMRHGGGKLSPLLDIRPFGRTVV